MNLIYKKSIEKFCKNLMFESLNLKECSCINDKLCCCSDINYLTSINICLFSLKNSIKITDEQDTISFLEDCINYFTLIKNKF